MAKDIEGLGKMADKCESLIALSQLRLPITTHVEYLVAGLKEIAEEIRGYYKLITNQDPWED